MRRVLLALAFGLAASGAVAQIAPSPADVGVSKGTPDVFKLKGHDNVWTPFGSVDPSTHIFIPATNGNIAPNDCVKWGPGLTSAGAACNSVTGGATPANQLTIYTNHAGLLANVTTPSEAWTVTQQGFYAPGDGGAATYQWSLTSYCTGGTSGAPTAADGVACVLPVGQSAGTAGRYLLQLDNGLDVRQIGMVGDGAFDNSPLVSTLMHLMEPGSSQGGHMDVFFPVKPQQRYTDYSFSAPFHVTRTLGLRCQSTPSGGGDASARLVFPVGVHGLVFDNPITSPDGTGYGGGAVSGCGVVSSGYHQSFPVTTGSNAVLTVPADFYFHNWDFEVGDGIIVYLYTPTNGAPALPGGTTITAVNSGAHTITPSSPVPSSYTGNGHAIYRLPVEKAFTVQTTTGSPTITVTGGPSVLQPGDYIWSDAFPFGTTLISTSGTLGAQTVTAAQYPLNGNVPVNATVTHSSGSPGKMWIIPAAIKTYVQLSLNNNWLGTFGFGLEMECSYWSSAQSNCINSFARENQFWFSIVGRIVMGDNSGASTSIGNTYAYNSFADIVEGGAVGSTYYNENANSQEASTSIYGIVGECVNSNSSAFFGGYNTSTGGYCTNGQLGAGTTAGGVVMFIANQNATPSGAPSMYNGTFINNWYFNQFDAPQVQVCMNHTGSALAWSRDNQGCGGPETWRLVWDSRGMWAWDYFTGTGGASMWMTEGAAGGYTGYKAGNHALINFYNGFLLYDLETGGSSPGPERLVDEGLTVPVGTFHKFGDIHFNQDSNGNKFMAWENTIVFAPSLGPAVVSGTTTSVPITACPNPALPVGTPIDYYTGNNAILPVFLGTLASCTAGTLTFQAAAVGDAPAGGQLLFMQWHAAGPVANDAAGTSWTLGNTMTLTPVALASLPPTCTAGTFAVINNGVATPTYNAAVGSTTGAATDPVFCGNGNVWTYH